MSADAYKWRCACCDEEHEGLPMSLVFGPPSDRLATDEVKPGGLLVGDDLCLISYVSGEVGRYIRGQLALPVPALNSEFYFGVWMSVAPPIWHAYRLDLIMGADPISGCFGYLMDEIPDFEGSRGAHADVWFQPNGLRPLVRLHKSDHALYAGQQSGVDPKQVERWAAFAHVGPGAE